MDVDDAVIRIGNNHHAIPLLDAVADQWRDQLLGELPRYLLSNPGELSHALHGLGVFYRERRAPVEPDVHGAVLVDLELGAPVDVEGLRRDAIRDGQTLQHVIVLQPLNGLMLPGGTDSNLYHVFSSIF